MMPINLFCCQETSVSPCQYVDKWEKLNQISLPQKDEFYSNLNIEDIADADYMHLQKSL